MLVEQHFQFRIIRLGLLVGAQTLGGWQRRDGGVGLSGVQHHAIEQCLVVFHVCI